MIRYATADDADWIVSLQEANPEIVVSVQRGDELLNQINSGQYIICESDDGTEQYSFILFKETPDNIWSMLLLTEAAHRKCGHARELYMYLYAKYKKPIRYLVKAGSDAETMWTTHNEYVIETVQKIGSRLNSDGTTYNEYLTAGSGYVE